RSKAPCPSPRAVSAYARSPVEFSVARGSDTLQHHHRNLAAGLGRVIVVGRPYLLHLLPQPLALLARDGAHSSREHLVLDLKLDFGFLLDVPVPAGMLLRAAVRGDQHVAISVHHVDERRRPLLAGLPALRREEQDGRAPPPDMPHGAAGFPVAAHMI